MTNEDSQSRIQRATAWLEKWNPRLALITDYVAYLVGIYMVVWAIWGESTTWIPTLPAAQLPEMYPRIAVLVFGFMIYVLAKDAVQHNKRQVFSHD